MKKNKKGSIQDLIFWITVLLFFSMVLLIGYKVVGAISDKVGTMDVVPAEGKTANTQLTGYFSTSIDSSFLFLTIGIALATLAMATLVRIHPVFIIFYIIGLVIVIILSAIFSNVYQTMAANPQLSTQANNLLFTSTIMEYLPLFVGIFGTLLAIIMYKGWKDSE